MAPGALLDRTIAGERAVFFRTTDGTLKALENRCLHRSAPLSLGIHEGDAVRCNYHGIKYDADGACIEIPGQSMIPKRACVRSYPVVERQGWIWFWPGDAELADPARIPQIQDLGEPGWRMRTGYLHYNTNHELINDNLLDLSHISYLHSRTLGAGNMSWGSEAPTLQRRDNGLFIERWMTNVPRTLGDAPVHDNLNTYEFIIPGILAIHSVFQPAGSGTRENMSAEITSECWTWQAITPATEKTTHYFFSLATPEQMSTDEYMDEGMKFLLLGFEEDRIMIEAQQRVIDEDPLGRGIASMTTTHDAAALQMRKVWRRMVEEERAGAKSAAAA